MIDERAVVADQEESPRPVDEQCLEQFERLDVEIVGRLVEHQEIRRPGEQSRQEQAVAFTA